MNQIEGLKGCFKNSKIVYLVTFTKDGTPHSRPMTNFNDDPYNLIWFPSYRDTRKINDIMVNEKVLVIFPSCEIDKFYEIEGKASLAPNDDVENKWEWWYLYWHPELNDRFWFSPLGKHPERAIINVQPIKVRILKKDEVKYIRDVYKTVIPQKGI